MRITIAILLMTLAGCGWVSREDWQVCRDLCGEEPKAVHEAGGCSCEKYGNIDREEVKRRLWLRDQKPAPQPAKEGM